MITTRDRLAALVEAVYDKTLDGTLAWEPTATKGAVSCRIGSAIIHMDDEPSERFELDFRMSVFDRDGNQVDTFSNSMFYDMEPRRFPFDSYYKLMENLLELARRKVTGADAILDELLVKLEAPPVHDPDASKKRPSAFDSDLDDGVPF